MVDVVVSARDNDAVGNMVTQSKGRKAGASLRPRLWPRKEQSWRIKRSSGAAAVYQANLSGADGVSWLDGGGVAC
jgi:hypothetical protein